MPNYSLVVNSRFRPFSFERYIQPYQIYGQAYREQQDTLAALDDLASDLSGKINPNLDKDLYNQYNDFANKMSEIAEELSTKGLTPDSRQKLLSARSRYKKEIEPIKEAYNRKLEDIKRQDMLQDKSNGRMIFNRDARLSSLSDYYNGNVPEFAQVNLDHVVNAGVEGGKAISSRYIKTKEGQRFANDYYSLIKQTGIENQDEVLEILKNSGKYPEFSRFYNDTLTNYGYNNFDESGKMAMEAALREGLNRGIVHNETETLQNNWRAQKAVDHYYHELQAEAAANREINKAAQLAQIKAAGDKNDRINNMFTPVVPQGVTGEPDADLDRASGLRKVPEKDVPTLVKLDKLSKNMGKTDRFNVTTDKLDKLERNLEAAKKALADYEGKKNLSDDDTRLFRIYENTPSATLSNTRGQLASAYSANERRISNVNQNYYNWQKLYAKVKDAENEYNKERDYLKDLANKYSAYGDNMYDRIKTGINAKQAYLGQQKLFYGLNTNNTSRNELKASIAALTSAGATIERTKDGKKITGDNLNGEAGILSEKKNTAIGVTVDRDKVFLSLNDENGTEYKIKGIRHIEDFNERLSFVNKKLGDFHSQRTPGNVYNVPANFTGDIVDVLEAARKAGKAEHPRNTNMYAATVRMPVNGRSELVNIVSDGQNIYVQTQTDELYNGGKSREAAISNAAAAALDDLLPTLAQKP